MAEFDEPVRERAKRQDQPDPHGDPHVLRQCRTAVLHPVVERHVPKIEAVAHHSHDLQRRDPQHARHPAAFRQGGNQQTEQACIEQVVERRGPQRVQPKLMALLESAQGHHHQEQSGPQQKPGPLANLVSQVEPRHGDAEKEFIEAAEDVVGDDIGPGQIRIP
jgi:hypothetical protein